MMHYTTNYQYTTASIRATLDLTSYSFKLIKYLFGWSMGQMSHSLAHPKLQGIQIKMLQLLRDLFLAQLCMVVRLFSVSVICITLIVCRP